MQVQIHPQNVKFADQLASDADCIFILRLMQFDCDLAYSHSLGNVFVLQPDPVRSSSFHAVSEPLSTAAFPAVISPEDPCSILAYNPSVYS